VSAQAIAQIHIAWPRRQIIDGLPIAEQASSVPTHVHSRKFLSTKFSLIVINYSRLTTNIDKTVDSMNTSRCTATAHYDRIERYFDAKIIDPGRCIRYCHVSCIGSIVFVLA
jgi:hypothetical protein